MSRNRRTHGGRRAYGDCETHYGRRTCLSERVVSTRAVALRAWQRKVGDRPSLAVRLDAMLPFDVADRRTRDFPRFWLLFPRFRALAPWLWTWALHQQFSCQPPCPPSCHRVSIRKPRDRGLLSRLRKRWLGDSPGGRTSHVPAGHGVFLAIANHGSSLQSSACQKPRARSVPFQAMTSPHNEGFGFVPDKGQVSAHHLFCTTSSLMTCQGRTRSKVNGHVTIYEAIDS
jgi:hypothetical protein